MVVPARGLNSCRCARGAAVAFGGGGGGGAPIRANNPAHVSLASGRSRLIIHGPMRSVGVGDETSVSLSHLSFVCLLASSQRAGRPRNCNNRIAARILPC